MKSNLFLSAAVVGALSLASCSKDGGGGSDMSTAREANMTYQLDVVNTSSSSQQKSLANGTFHWTSGYANPTLVKFEAKQDGTKIEYKSANTAPIDIFAPVAMDFGGFVLPAGTYREIELAMRLNGHSTEPALLLNGTYTYNGVVTPISLVVEDEMWLKSEMEDVTVGPNSTVATIMDLDLSGFLMGVSDNMLMNAQLTNGTIVISRDSNRDFYNRILSNITGKRHHGHYKHH
jgi:hypothetical protein